jgi:predicted HTH transcriptional regulator
MDINEIIQQGESKYVEFKSWIKVANKKELMNILTNEAVGFANTDGGIILVGVEDDGEITGCYDYDEQNIIESIYDKTIPKLFTDIDVIGFAGKDILKITIQKSPEIVATSKGVVYKRLEPANNIPYPLLILILVSLKGIVRFCTNFKEQFLPLLSNAISGHLSLKLAVFRLLTLNIYRSFLENGNLPFVEKNKSHNWSPLVK